MIDNLIAQLSEGTVLAPLLAFAVGALLSLSPVALPSTAGGSRPRTLCNNRRAQVSDGTPPSRPLTRSPLEP